MRLVAIFVIASYFLVYLCECKERNSGNKIETVSDPDIFRNVSELISSKGYPVQDHTVQTADGFILSVQRIPHGRNGCIEEGGKQVVLLLHGALGSAADWVLNFPEQSLGFILADAGYDVWLGNSRGNTYSRRHVKYSTNDNKFWDFSFDEIAQHDLPAMIDYVLNATDEVKLYYIGHSQGTSVAFAMLSEYPEYNEKLILFVALSPVTSIGTLKTNLRYLIPYRNIIASLLNILGMHEFLPSSPTIKFLSKGVFGGPLFGIFGKKKQLNESRTDVYAAHIPCGSSVKNLLHYGQMANSKKFAKFDYGKDNQEHYNQPTPPKYDVSRITTPVALVWSMQDKISNPADVGILQDKLKSMVSSYCVPLPEFGHVDFLLAVDARKMVYDHVLSLLAHY